MNSLILMMLVSFVATDWSNDWTPRVATEGAIVTLENEATPAPLPMPMPDSASQGAKVEGPLDSYREAKALIEKGNALADRGKAFFDQAQRDGKITVDIRLPNPPANETPARRQSCANGSCPLDAAAAEDPAANAEPTPTCTRGDRKSRRFLRWRR